jgi:hypothetical protein
MKLAFGANVNVAKILRLDASYDKTKIKHKTGLFARVYQRNFTATMDYPSDGNLFKNNYCCPVNEKIKSRKKGNKSRWILPQSYYLCVAKQKRW